MEQIQLGSTKLTGSRIGLGFAALGRPGYIALNHHEDIGDNYNPGAMQEHAHRILDAAWEAGIRYFDTARSYGKAEEFVGNWLQTRSVSSDEVIIASKWGYTYTADWQIQAETHEIKDHSLSVLKKQWQETQSNLGNYLDLYQIHSATLESRVLSNPDVLNELADLKQKGVAIGLTTSGPNQASILNEALKVTFDGVRLFNAVQITWNLLERSATDVLHEVKSAGIGIIVKEAVANGRLTTRNQESNFTDKRLILEQQANRLNTTVDALAIAGVLAQPWVDVVLSGAATVDQLLSNILALNVTWDAEAENALGRIVESPQSYWETRSKLTWN